MVYCGKPSKGCSNCRERKIRVSHILEISSRVFSNSAFMGWLAPQLARCARARCGMTSPSDDPTLKTKR